VVGVKVKGFGRGRYYTSISSISYRDMKGIPEYKVGAADLPKYPLAVKFLLCSHSICKCLPAYQISTFGVTGLRDWV